mmetsp:Transcript_68650/g.200918  ORF Transcript_68650/g.200918 Transcript_68650/m.200918 type:complete len:102 (+) Transcript_68650:133-438(+)
MEVEMREVADERECRLAAHEGDPEQSLVDDDLHDRLSTPFQCSLGEARAVRRAAEDRHAVRKDHQDSIFPMTSSAIACTSSSSDPSGPVQPAHRRDCCGGA